MLHYKQNVNKKGFFICIRSVYHLTFNSSDYIKLLLIQSVHFDLGKSEEEHHRRERELEREREKERERSRDREREKESERERERELERVRKSREKEAAMREDSSRAEDLSSNATVSKQMYDTVNSLYNAEVGVHRCERLIEKTHYKSNVL